MTNHTGSGGDDIGQFQNIRSTFGVCHEYRLWVCIAGDLDILWLQVFMGRAVAVSDVDFFVGL